MSYWFCPPTKQVLNEHTFVVPENLLCFLQGHYPQSRSAKATTQPLFLGHRLTLEDGTAFNSGRSVGDKQAIERCSNDNDPTMAYLFVDDVAFALHKSLSAGGAGFLLNTAARDRLLQGLEEGSKACQATTEWAKTNAGVVIAQCLASLGVPALSTRGAGNRERFHVYGPSRTSEAAVDEWFVNYHQPEIQAAATAAAAASQAATGCCAPDTVSFHYVGPLEARAIARVLYPATEEEGERCVRAMCVCTFLV